MLGLKLDLASCPIKFLFNDANDETSQKEKFLDQINSKVAGVSKRENTGYLCLLCVSMHT